MPAHNAEATVELAIAAVLGQEYKPGLELVVVDDASTDATPALAKKFPVKMVRLSKNAGAGAARNQGAKSASGEILVFVDADVYLDPGALSAIADFFALHPESSALVGNYSAAPADRGAFSVYHNFFTTYHHELSRERIEWFWGALSAVRKHVFDRLGGFSEKYPGASAEDIELGYRLSESGFQVNFQPGICGRHARKFKLRSMLYNDFHKAVLGTKLYWTRKPAGKHPHGFSSPLNGLNLALAILSWPALLSSILHGGILYLLLFGIFAAANFRFYQYIQRRAGALYAITSIPLHWLTFNAIAGGAIAGAIGLALGKGLESGSRWI